MNQVAQRYARALFSTEAKKVEDVRQEMLALGRLIEGSQELTVFMKAKRFGRQAQALVLNAVSKKLKLSPLTHTFLNYVCAQGRVGFIGQMAQAFDRLACDAKGQIRAHIHSVAPLTKADEGALEGALSKALKKEIFLDQAVDEQLLGGLTVRIGSTFIDGSLKTKLAQLHQVIREG